MRRGLRGEAGCGGRAAAGRFGRPWCIQVTTEDAGGAQLWRRQPLTGWAHERRRRSSQPLLPAHLGGNHGCCSTPLNRRKRPAPTPPPGWPHGALRCVNPTPANLNTAPSACPTFPQLYDVHGPQKALQANALGMGGSAGKQCPGAMGLTLLPVRRRCRSAHQSRHRRWTAPAAWAGSSG